MVVVMFLFYSGYGVMCAIMSKGTSYVNAIPRKRLLTVWLNFMVAVCVFFAARNMFQIEPEASLKTFALSLVCWDSVGNSNWYIFVILLLYLLTYVSFKNNVSRGAQLGLLVALSATSIIALAYLKPYWWYDTLMAYPFGAAFAYWRPKIEKAASHTYLLMLAVAVAVFVWTYEFGNQMPGLWHNLRAVAFAMALVLLSMKWQPKSKALAWMGRNLFPLYIYQRLPMMVLAAPLCAERTALYFIICLGCTFALAYAYRFIEIRITTNGRAVVER